mmetsp:Transcript_27508/g.59120  ORF Transcript_27508/g.59120 Transcript_27508/m.59120 type:complete len:306 (+) Transcript_27508:1092-2009(+)
MTQPSKFALAPSINLSHVRQATSMKPTCAQLHHLLPAQTFQQFGSVLMALSVAVSGNSVFLVAPGVQATLIRNHRRMPTPTSNVHNAQPHQRLHPPRRAVPALVPVSQLSVHASSPREQIAIAGNRSRVVATAGHVGDDLTGERVREARHVLPAIVPVAQSAVVAASPGVHLPFSGQNDRVTAPAGDLLDAHSAERIDVGGLVLIGRVSDAELSVLAASPGVDGEFVGVGEGGILRVMRGSRGTTVARVGIVIGGGGNAATAAGAAVIKSMSARGMLRRGSSSGIEVIIVGRVIQVIVLILGVLR